TWARLPSLAACQIDDCVLVLTGSTTTEVTVKIKRRSCVLREITVSSVVGVCRFARLLSSLAPEAGGLVDAAAARVLRDERVRAQRSRAINFSVQGVRRDDGGRRFPLLDPVLELRQHVELIRPRAAAAVMHAGYEIEARETVGFFLSADRLRHLLVVIERAVGADRGIRPAVIHDDLAAAAFVGCE